MFEYFVAPPDGDLDAPTAQEIMNAMGRLGWKYVGPDAAGRDVYERQVPRGVRTVKPKPAAIPSKVKP